ncbi:MAG TPA: cytochrome c [Thermoanaerobaculia bacterium]|nr:cytochrome c [Thermoanaerobaculia bacterium]
MHHRSLVLGAAAALTLPVAAAALDAPTFNRDIAPILYANCVGCHSPNQIGPMSLRTYDEARPWAKSIAQSVQSRTMPPWHADPGYGPWSNDRSLNADEVDTVVRWVAAGAPRGEGEAPPLPEVIEAEWVLGEPDVILEIDPVEIAADGPDRFVQKVIPTGFETDRFVTALEVRPGDRQVVHHVLLWMANESGTAPQSLLGGWAAGADPTVTPEGTGRLVKKGHPLIFDLHYHPYGVATTDRTRIGLHLADSNEAIEKELVNLWVLNADFEIPAGDPDVEAAASHTFAQDVRLLALTPHMHYRGKDFQFTAVLPDGTSKELLKVSRYDFNWQTGYEFAEPIELPAGSRVDCLAHWDNSTANLNNPDPEKNVRWGLQSTDEMMIGFVDYVVKDGVSPKPVSPVLGKLPELAKTHPGQVWRVDVPLQPGKPPEPTAVHLPRAGNGGWYVGFGNMVLPAPIHSIVWDGNRVTAKADIPNQGTTEMSGVVLDSGDIDLTMGPGTIRGIAAEKVKPAASIPSGR